MMVSKNRFGWTVWVLVLSLMVFFRGTDGLLGNSVTVHRAPDPEGPHVVLVVPVAAHEASIGIACQVATLPLQRGTLTVIQADRVLEQDRLGELLKRSLPVDERPNWIWVHQGIVQNDDAGQKITAPTIHVQAADVDPLRKTAARIIPTEVTVAVIDRESLNQSASCGVAFFAYPSGTPPSRQIRYTRLLVTALLRDLQLLADDAAFCWQRLRDGCDRLIALYDAEGIGGGGPVNLERIAAQQLRQVRIYRVCGEDIREGALSVAATSIFPGGSGRGIGNGLQSEGRERLREFIEAGGGYLGVCAGAYFAGSGLENYLHAIPLIHSQPWARGRAMLEIELTDEGRQLLGTDQRVLTTRYNNGPIFLDSEQPDGGDPEFMVLARFKTPSTDSRGNTRDEMVGQAAIGARALGQGRILIISPHPESHRQHDPLVARAIQWTMESNSLVSISQ